MTKGREQLKRDEALRWKILGERFKLPPKVRDWLRLMSPPQPQKTLLEWRRRAAEQGTTLPAIVQFEYYKWRHARRGTEGKPSVRISPELHRRIQSQCATRGVKMSEAVRAALEAAFPATAEEPRTTGADEAR
jgi:hypothetical protein